MAMVLACGRERRSERGPISAGFGNVMALPQPKAVSRGATGSNRDDSSALGSATPIAGAAGNGVTNAYASSAPAADLRERPRPTQQLRVRPGKRSVAGNSGMVVSVNADATHIGLSILESGGNAVDAAVAVAFALAVTHPSAGNIGGGGFALVHLPNGENRALDFRESSPANLEHSRFTAMALANGTGPDSVAIPGSVAGLFELAQSLGRLPFAKLVEPAQRLAELGHRISAREATAIRVGWRKFKGSRRLLDTYGKNRKDPLPEGSWLKLPALARTLSRLRLEGRDGFYTGSVATSLVRSLGQNPQIQLGDLADYRAIWRPPIELIYRGLRVTIAPPPSAGGIALASSLTMLSQYDPSTLERNSPAHTHLLLEIMRRAQADRIYGVVDPDTLTAEQNAKNLAAALDPQRWQMRCPIDASRATPNDQVIGDENPLSESEHTTHLGVVDGQGMAVSLTTTLSSGFGSLVVTDTGIILNNALGSFSGKGLNQPLPNRRTVSSMAPTLVEDRDGLRLILGTPGGDTIPSTMLQLLNALVDYAIALDEAVDAPRLHQSIDARGTARMERGHPIPTPLEQSLRKLGHRFAKPTSAMGHANSIAILDGRFYGYVDPREGGLALGWAEKQANMINLEATSP